MKVITILHILLSLALGGFFIYAGVQKFIPKERKPSDPTEMVDAVTNNKYENPIPFKLSVKMLSTSGFLKFVGVLQILAGLLIVITQTRLIGLMLLLPLTINIFCFHLFMDNRMDENIETGSILLVNILLFLAYYKKLGTLLHSKILLK
jgi:uncharacterized membrane protein YphA (DoxX/SURF4 family)